MEHVASLRERLIDAGVDLVLADGASAVGLREIARQAGVSHGAPRRHFPTHRALLSAIARRGFADLSIRFAAATAEVTEPRAQLAAIARVYVGYALERRGMFELMFRHDLLNSATGGSDQPRLRESALPLFARFVELVARCSPEGGPPAVVAAALWANLHGIAQLWTWGSLQLVDEADGAGVLALDRLVGAALDAHLCPPQ